MLPGDSIDSVLDSYISSVNKDDRVAGIYFSLNTKENPDVDTIYIYEVATKKLLYTMTLDESNILQTTKIFILIVGRRIYIGLMKK